MLGRTADCQPALGNRILQTPNVHFLVLKRQIVVSDSSMAQAAVLPSYENAGRRKKGLGDTSAWAADGAFILPAQSRLQQRLGGTSKCMSSRRMLCANKKEILVTQMHWSITGDRCLRELSQSVEQACECQHRTAAPETACWNVSSENSSIMTATAVH
jgi:hypothetical protein